MKKIGQILMVLLVLSPFTQALSSKSGKEDIEKATTTKVKVGPIVDKIYMNVKMKQEIGLMDVAEGKSDIFFFGVDGPVIMGLDQATRDKLDIYKMDRYFRERKYGLIIRARKYLSPHVKAFVRTIKPDIQIG